MIVAWLKGSDIKHRIVAWLKGSDSEHRIVAWLKGSDTEHRIVAWLKGSDTKHNIVAWLNGSNTELLFGLFSACMVCLSYSFLYSFITVFCSFHTFLLSFFWCMRF